MEKLYSLYWIILILLNQAAGFWRLTCPARSGLGRLDPIASLGVPSKHAHVIHGGGDFGLNVTGTDLTNSICTSCSVVQDKSAYWVPALYFTPDNSTYTMVQQVGGLLIYYELLSEPGERIVAFPPGFQMISGDSSRRSFNLPVPDPEKSAWQPRDKTQDALAQKALGFNCLRLENPEPSLDRHFMPDKTFLDANCPFGLRTELMFPSCWDGKHIDSPNHKDHVAFSDLVLGGSCPPGFGIRIPSIHYEVVWNTSAFKDHAGTFVLASGDSTGYGFHGDFMNGWDIYTLQLAVDSCTNLSGQLEDCPPFQLQHDAKAFECSFTVPIELIGEDCYGPRHHLPGNIISSK